MIGVEIEGLADFRKALRDAADATPRELTKALRKGAQTLKDRASANASTIAGSHAEGKIPASFRIYSRAREAGIVSSLPQAGVFEFATSYMRRSRSADRPPHRVTFHDIGSPPRFGYKALGELEEELTQMAYDALVEVAKAHGWFTEGSD